MPIIDVRFAQSSQGAAAMLLRSSLAKSQKSSERLQYFFNRSKQVDQGLYAHVSKIFESGLLSAGESLTLHP